MGYGLSKDPATRISRTFSSGLVGLGLFTFVVDILLLVQPIYMLQIYDRVLPSASIETLVLISILAAGMLLFLGLMDTLRSMMASRIAARMDTMAGGDVLVASLEGSKASLGDVQPLRDFATVRGFVANKGVLAWLDLPFAPIFIGILWFLHPHLFWLTAGGAVVLSVVAVLNQFVAGRAEAGAEQRAIAPMLSAQAFVRSAETVKAMGMTRNVVGAWGVEEAASLRTQERLNTVNSIFTGMSRFLRLGLQIAILGYGGYLVVAGQMNAGMIFAASLISGRGLQPIDQIVGGWKNFVETRKAWKRLKTALARVPAARKTTELPAPTGRLVVENVVVHAPNAALGDEPVLRRVSAAITAGETVAVVGPSGAGKSTLARTIVGAVQPRAGCIRLDGADIATWRPEQLGRAVGYLSQEADLLPGTVGQNISRFDPDATDADIVEAARKAQVHDLVLGLKSGYDTIIGPAGQQLSGGQRQRIGLARAFYGSPCLLVLDEPNANLDIEGDMALDRALAEARKAGTTVVVVTQRKPLADRADRVMVVRNGNIEDFGTPKEVAERQNEKYRRVQPRPAAVRPAQATASSNGRHSLVIDGTRS